MSRRTQRTSPGTSLPVPHLRVLCISVVESSVAYSRQVPPRRHGGHREPRLFHHEPDAPGTVQHGRIPAPPPDPNPYKTVRTVGNLALSSPRSIRTAGVLARSSCAREFEPAADEDVRAPRSLGAVSRCAGWRWGRMPAVRCRYLLGYHDRHLDGRRGYWRLPVAAHLSGGTTRPDEPGHW